MTWRIGSTSGIGARTPAVEAWLDEHFNPANADRFGSPGAVVAVAADGAVLAERYNTEAGISAASQLTSWSMAKSITHTLVGQLVDAGRLVPEATAASQGIDAWLGLPDEDPRTRITLEHLLRMIDGLRFAEDYVDAGVSDVIEMLFGSGAADIAAYAASRPSAHEPGTVWSYSSGTTNIISAIVGAVLGGRDAVEAAIQNLFAALGGGPVDARFDAAGTFVGSSYVFATARDFARFGLLHLHGGLGADGQRLLSEAWCEHGRTPTPESNGEYGAQWWLVPGYSMRHRAQGYETQRTYVARDRGMVVVRLGKTPADIGGEHTDAWINQGLDSVL